MLGSSGVIRKSRALIVRYSQKKEIYFFCFLLFWESSNCYNFVTTGPIQVGFSANVPLFNEYFNQIENWKCHMFDFRLISLDRITNVYLTGNNKLNIDFQVSAADCLWYSLFAAGDDVERITRIQSTLFVRIEYCLCKIGLQNTSISDMYLISSNMPQLAIFIP